jgi:hypothetical protein
MRKNAGGGKFVSLKDGDEIEGAFAGVLAHGLEGDEAEPMGVEVVWIEGQNGRYSVEYDPAVHDADDMRVSFMWNVLVRGEAEDGSQDEMKILQQGSQLFDLFIKHKSKKGYSFWFTVGRTGSGQFDTKYSLDREDRLNEDDLEAIKKMELHDLDKEASASNRDQGDDSDEDDKPKGRSRRRRAAEAPRTKSNGASTSSGGNGSTGLSSDQRSQIKAVLQGLKDPNQAQDSLKKRFGISKMSELPVDEFDAAKHFLENIGRGESDSAADVDDPFFD